MNEKLQEALLAIINKTIAATGQATDFVLAETPEVLQQLLMWKMTESLVWLTTGILSIVVLLCVSFSIAKKIKVYNEDVPSYKEMPTFLPHIVSSLIVSAVFLECVVVYTLEATKIWLAPKVYLIEYAASLVK